VNSRAKFASSLLDCWLVTVVAGVPPAKCRVAATKGCKAGGVTCSNQATITF
jgi:hypothetical protein